MNCQNRCMNCSLCGAFDCPKEKGMFTLIMFYSLFVLMESLSIKAESTIKIHFLIFHGFQGKNELLTVIYRSCNKLLNVVNLGTFSV